MRFRSVTTLALAGSLVLLGAACSNNDDPATTADDTVETTDEPTTTEADEPTVPETTDEPTAPDTSDEPAPPPTLAPGEPIRVTAPSRTVETLSDECVDTVAGLREIMGRYDSGLQITAEDADEFNVVIGSVFGADSGCSPDELREFNDAELQPWLTPPPTAAVADGAADLDAGEADEATGDE